MSDRLGQVSTRCFAAGRASFVVHCSTVTTCDVVEALFTDLHDALPAQSPIDIHLLDSADGTLVLQLGDDPPVTGALPNDALATLVTSVSRLSLDADPDSLHLHCAALSLGEHGVLISAASGTGKTTLAAALAERGWTYVSDETVAFAKDRATGTGFPKPLMIKPGGRELLPHLVSAAVTFDADDERWLHVPVGALAAPIHDQVTPSAVVILRRAADGSTDRRPDPETLHPTDAVVALMSQTMDAERFGPNAIEVLARIAASSRCVILDVGPIDETAAVIEGLVLSATEPQPVRLLDSHGIDGQQWLIGDNVRSLVIGDRAVVHDTAAGAIAALDEAGTGVWLALHGETPPWWEPETLVDPGIVEFLEQLESHRLVQRSITSDYTGG